MPRHRSAKNNRPGPLNSTSQNVPQTSQRRHNSLASAGDTKNLRGDNRLSELESVRGIENVKPLLDDDSPQQPSPSSSNNTQQSLSSSTAALHDELDSFRQRWRRELETSKKSDLLETTEKQEAPKSDKPKQPSSGLKDFYSVVSNPPDDPEEVYTLARKLFLMGVELEQDELHNESIRYYKQAMHLCPDIEKLIFREQCEASKLKGNNHVDTANQLNVATKIDNEEDKLPLADRIKQAFYDNLNQDQAFAYCRPNVQKSKTKHISDLPHDLLLQIFRYVIGTELDLASLETLGMVCRGFHVLAHDSSLWRSICHSTWSEASLAKLCSTLDSSKAKNMIDWKQVYLDKPRVNCDGVYISRTKYIRQGDVGFQDITYRPFHVVRYYRYLRFFPDNRVLILTTNEEPDKIIPIFRHAMDSKQFSSELSILDGTYELMDEDEIVIKAEKDFTNEHNQQQQQQQQTYNQRRQARFHWSRQTPQWQRFDLKFKLKTLESRPFRNNTLKWLEYSILSRTELGQELTEFDLTSDTFPNLAFSRVKRFNLRSSEPLASH